MNIIEITEKFPTELHCIKLFEKHRWGRKIKCAHCESTTISKRAKDYRFHCWDCRKSFSVTTKTRLHNTRLTLQKWLFAFSIVSDAKKGLSAMQLQRNLNISYPTAWKIYHQMRDLMNIENEEIELEGIVEMDETYVGGKPRKFNTGETTPPKQRTSIPELDKQLKELKDAGIKLKRGKGNPAYPDINPKRGRGTNKTPVVGIVQRDGNVIAQVMKDLKGKNLLDMMKKYVDEEDSILITDEYSGYNRFSEIIEHLKIDHQKLYSYKGVNTNTIESFWAIIKRQIIGQHHHVSVKHLPKYVSEIVFKFNNRKKDDMFLTLVKKSLTPIS